MTTSLALHTPQAPMRARAMRRYELDWLRAFVVLGLIPFHAAAIFSSAAGVYLKNSQTSQSMALLAVFVEIWGMPLLFAVAGAGAWFALDRRTPARYLGERVQRLIIPFIFASLTLIPIQIYAILAANPQLIHSFTLPIHDPSFMSSWLAYYVEYLRGYGYFLTHFSPSLALVFWGHLWFIPRLFIYALGALPLFLWLKRPGGARALARLDHLLSTLPGAIFLFSLPLTLIEMLIRALDLNRLTASWPVYDDWTQFAFFLVYVIYGYLVLALPGAQAAIKRSGWWALALGVGGFGLALWLVGVPALTSNPLSYSLGSIAGVPLHDFVSWFWVVAILSFAMHALTFTNRLLRYLNEAAFPIYVIHMPILTVVAAYALQLDLPWWLKLVLIISAALAVTMGVYELIIRRVRILRALFGMKPLQPATEPRELPVSARPVAERGGPHASRTLLAAPDAGGRTRVTPRHQYHGDIRRLRDARARARGGGRRLHTAPVARAATRA
jgi:glucans biosynthesis protein C